MQVGSILRLGHPVNDAVAVVNGFGIISKSSANCAAFCDSETHEGAATYTGITVFDAVLKVVRTGTSKPLKESASLELRVHKLRAYLSKSIAELEVLCRKSVQQRVDFCTLLQVLSDVFVLVGGVCRGLSSRSSTGANLSSP